MSCKDFVSEPQYSEESYNWSKLRKKYLDQELPSEKDQSKESENKPKKYKKYRKGLTFEEIANLHLKKKNLEDFISSIGSLATRTLRKEALQHCEKVRINFPSSISGDSLNRMVKNRVEKMIKNKRIKKNWSEEDIKILVWVISKYCDLNDIASLDTGLNENDWEYIANLIPGVSGKSCMFKWLSLKKNSLAENGWAEEESLILDFVVKKYGVENWCQISEELYELNNLPTKIYRCPKQCREHWNCYLNPNLKKGPWSKTQDILLLKAVKDLNGMKKWAEIVKLFDGRTENALKNRYNLIIEKELKQIKSGRKKITELQLIDKYLEKVMIGDNIHNSKLNSLRESIKKRQRVFSHYTVKTIQNKSNSQSAQYIPEYNESTRRRRRQFVKKEEELDIKKEDKIGNFLNLDDSNHCHQNQQYISNEHESYQHVHHKEEQPIFEEEQDFYQIEKKPVPFPSFSFSPKQRTKNQQIKPQSNEMTAEECINIDVSKIKMIDYSPQLLQKLKLDLTKSKFNLIPCTLENNNVFMSYPMNKNEE